MSHDVRAILDNCKVITNDGSLLFSYKSTKELVLENLGLVKRLKEISPISLEIFKSIISPLIYRFAKIVSVVPASKFLHDSDSGGLLRHSLLVAIKAVELNKLNQKMSLDHESEYVLLIFLSLLHDCGKVLSDVEISSRRITFSYRNDKLNFALDDFLQKHKSDFVKIRYIDNRHKAHELSTAQMLQFLLYGQKSIAKYLINTQSKEAINAILLSDTRNQFYKVIKTADIYACATSINKYSPMYEIGNFLRLLLLTKVIKLSVSGFYRVNGGYIVEKGSAAYQSIITAFDVYYELLNECKTFDNLSTQGFRQLYSIFQDSLTSRLIEQESLAELSDDSNFKYPKKSFFFEMADSNFYVQGVYKRSCIWRELYKKGKVKFVYGYIIAIDQEIFESEYSIVGEYKDDYVIDILRQNNLEFTDKANSSVTSFKVISEDDDKYLIDKHSVNRDSFCRYREELTLKNTKKRSQTKKKEKTAVNKEIAALQKVINETDTSELDEYWLY
ncbi:MAG: TraI domain-containing protein [Succinivibrio sp.]|nr:TraI domain-containing protein [Succinivibrio sp.]